MGTSISAIIQATTTGGTPPGLATSLAVSSIQSQQFTLTWVAPSTGNTPFTYTVQTRVTGTTSWTSASPVTVTTATVTGLQSGTQYDVQVMTSNGYGSPSTSAVLTVTTTSVSGTWNPSTSSATVTFSSDHLTATAGAFATGQQSQKAVGSISKTTGKWFFEVTAGAITTDWAVGLANAGYANDFIGSDANAIAYYPVSPLMSFWYNNNYISGASTGTADVSGAIISVAFDAGAQLFWATSPAMRTANGGAVVWNNSTTANPAAGTGGISFSGLSGAVFPIWETNEVTGSAKINYGGTGFSISAPSGFTALGGTNPLAPPAQPTGLTVTATTSTTAALSWTEPTTGGAAASYTIQAATVSSTGPAASATGTAATSSGVSIVDASGNLWSVAGGGYAAYNGVALSSITSNVAGLAYINGTMWQVNKSAAWYPFSVSGGSPSVNGGPYTTPSYTSPNNTEVTTVGAGIIDASGNIWGISGSKSVILNGTVDNTTSNVALLAYVGTKVWHQNTSGNWYSFVSVGSWTGGAATSPLTGSAVAAPQPSTTNAATSRQWWQQSGTNFCYFNIPFGANCTWGSASDADTQDLRYGGIINSPEFYGSPFYIGQSSDPTVTISVGNQGGYANQMYDGSVISSENWTVHLPSGANASGPFPIQFDQNINGCDMTMPGRYWFCGPINIQNYQGGMTYHIDDGGPYNVNGTDYTLGPSGGGNGSSFYREPVTVDMFHTQQEFPPSPNTIYNVHAGLIRMYDIDPAQNPARVPGTSIPAIQHVLRYSHDIGHLKANGVPGATSTPLNPNAWPMNFMDYQGPGTGNPYTGNLLAGTTIGIPQNVQMPSQLTDAGKQLWHCLQTYGAMYHDAGGGGLHLYSDQDVYYYTGSGYSYQHGNWSADAQNDLKNYIVPALCPLRNQHQGGTDFIGSGGTAAGPVNGPGPRVDPGPPPQALIPGFPVPSANYTTVTGTSGSITDSLGTIWTITSGGQVAYQVTRKISDLSAMTGNSVTPDTSTSNAVQLAYIWGIIWHRNTSNAWYCKTSSFSPWGWKFSNSTDPISDAKKNAYPGTSGPLEVSGTTQMTQQGSWVNVGSSTSTSGSATGLTANTKYVFQIIASNQAGSSAASATATGTTAAS